MSFEQISYLAQIVASVGVVVSLIFVGLQIRQNTAALQRNEHNSTKEQWTVIRMAIAKNRDIAELMTAGLHHERPLDAADQLRLEQMLQENAWAAFHIWDSGIFPKGTFEATGGALLGTLLRTPGGESWGAKPNILASILGSSWTSTPCSPRPNQAMQPTDGRRTVSLYFMKTRPLRATRAVASGGLILFSLGTTDL